MAHLVGRRTPREAYPVSSHAGAGSVPLSRILYVDPNSEAIGSPDGSDELPFLKIQDAFDSKFQAGQDFECSFLIVPCFNGANNAGPLSIPENTGFNTLVSIVGQNGSNRSIETPIVSTGMGALSLIGAISIEPSSQNTAINAYGVTIESITSTDPVDNVRISLDGCQTGTVLAANIDVLLNNTSVDGDLTAGTVESYSSTSLVGGTWTADEFRLDASTNWQLSTNGILLTGPGAQTPKIMCRAAQDVISVNVPAVAAGALGYVDVSTIGTMIAGVSVGTPIVANPLADLASAGANNGGFMSARVSTTNTIRCAFKGQLAGGAVNFLFARLS